MCIRPTARFERSHAPDLWTAAALAAAFERSSAFPCACSLRKAAASRFQRSAAALQKSSAAFTLLEVIMAMALIGMILGGVYGIANGAIQISKSMSTARVAETRISNFVTQWRDYLETMPPGIQLSVGVEKAARGSSGNLFILGGKMPFVWNRALKLADAVEFGIVRNPGTKDLSLVVLHLKHPEKARTPDEFTTIAELPILEGLKQMQWQFYEPVEKKWFTSWDPRKRPQPPLFMKLQFAFTADPREHEYTFWIANDLSQVTAPAAAAPVQP